MKEMDTSGQQANIMVSVNLFFIIANVVQVAVRIRPMQRKEYKEGDVNIVKTVTNKNVVILKDPIDMDDS